MIGIWYFSGTGNCKKLAKEIAGSFSDSETELKDVTPFNIRNQINKNISYDKLIIVFPIYAGDVPNVLKNFLGKLKGNGAAVILVALWGNVHSGKALINAQKILKKQGFLVTAGAEILAKHSYSFENVSPCDCKPTQKETSEIISFIKRNIENTDDTIIFPKAKESFVIFFLMLLPQSLVPRKAIKMNIDKQKCTKCRLCQKKCPVNAINDDMSINNNICIRCLSCESSCPVMARSHEFTTKIGKKFFAKHQMCKNENRFYESSST